MINLMLTKKKFIWSQVLENTNGKLNNTWDVFWYGFIFSKGFMSNSKISLTRNIGQW